MTAPTTPAVFIHGLWLHANSWQPWMDLFRESGYDPIAPGWPGESATVSETRRHPSLVADLGIDDITEHYAEIIRGLPAPAGDHRPLLRRPDHRETTRPGIRRRGCGDRSGPDQGGAAAAAGAAALGPARAG